VSSRRLTPTLEDLVKIHLVEVNEAGDDVPEHQYRRICYSNFLQELEGRNGKAREVHLGPRGSGMVMDDRMYENAAKDFEEEFRMYEPNFAAEVETGNRRDYILQLRNEHNIYDMGARSEAASDIVNVRAYESISGITAEIERRKVRKVP